MLHFTIPDDVYPVEQMDKVELRSYIFKLLCLSDKEILLDNFIKNGIVLHHYSGISFANGIELLERHQIKQNWCMIMHLHIL